MQTQLAAGRSRRWIALVIMLKSNSRREIENREGEEGQIGRERTRREMKAERERESMHTRIVGGGQKGPQRSVSHAPHPDAHHYPLRVCCSETQHFPYREQCLPNREVR